MKSKSENRHRWFRNRLIAALFSLGAIGSVLPAQAVVPSVYVPTAEELKGSSIGIGHTAAQLLQMGQAKEAAQLASLAVRLDPQNEKLWSVLAEAQLRSDQLEAASTSLARAKALNPTKAGLWFAEAAIALRAERPNSAIPLIERGLDLDPQNPSAYFDLGNARIMQGNLSAALTSFERATTLKPDFWEALNNQALVLFELGETKEAIRRWRRVLSLEQNAEPLLALAAALHQNKTRGDEAFSLANQALAKEPNYVLEGHQTEQLWGVKIRNAAALLLEEPELKAGVERAKANATWMKRR